MLKRNIPLRCQVVERVLTIEIGIDTLKFAAENSPKFWNGEADVHTLKVTNADQFAEDVRRALTAEEEDGSTPLNLLLDEMIEDAVDDGSEVVDYDEMERRAALTDVATDPTPAEPK